MSAAINTANATQGAYQLKFTVSAPGPKGPMVHTETVAPGKSENEMPAIPLDGPATFEVDNAAAPEAGPLTWHAFVSAGRGPSQELQGSPTGDAVGGMSKAITAATKFTIPGAAAAAGNVLTLFAVDASNNAVYKESFRLQHMEA